MTKTPIWIWAAATLVLLSLFGPLLTLIGFGFTSAAWSGNITDLALQAVKVSLPTSLIATVICCTGGVPLAYILARRSGRLVSLIRILTLMPLVMPPVVAGVALLKFWGRQGLLGSLLDNAGLSLAFTGAAVVLAQVFVALPFLVITAEAAFRSVNPDKEWVAASLGATPLQRLRGVTLPLAAPGLYAGALLCFARALGEFGATMMFAGSVEGVTRTLPIQISLSLNGDNPDSAIGLALILLALCAAIVGALQIPALVAIRRPYRTELRS